MLALLVLLFFLGAHRMPLRLQHVHHVLLGDCLSRCVVWKPYTPWASEHMSLSVEQAVYLPLFNAATSNDWNTFHPLIFRLLLVSCGRDMMSS